MVKRGLMVSIVDRPAALWWVAFAGASFLGLVFQVLLVPWLVPGGEGLAGLPAGGDVQIFHDIARALAEDIHQQGWDAWELRPQGQAPAGVLAAAYVLLGPWPEVVVPLYAALFATFVWAVDAILKQLEFSGRSRSAGGLFMVLLPSSLLIYGVPHKDGFSVAGAALILLGLLRVAGPCFSRTERAGARGFAIGAAVVLAGAVLIWIPRPYGLLLMAAGGVFLAFTATCGFLWLRGWAQRGMWLSLVLTWCMVVGLAFMGTSSGMVADVPVTAPSQASAPPAAPSLWEPSDWLPPFVDRSLAQLASQRHLYVLSHNTAASRIDLDVRLHDAVDILFYVPRAIEIGLLAPFPASWSGAADDGAKRWMRDANALEMAVSYVLLPCLLLAFGVRARSLRLAAILAFCIAIIALYALAIPNVGTLVRMRWGCWVILLSIGAAQLGAVLARVRSRAAVP